MHHTPAEAATEVGADQDTSPAEESARVAIGIGGGATLGLTAWALIALALLAIYLP